MYFYNAKTRESAWTKPDNVKIITQAEVEQMAAQAGGLQQATPSSVATSTPSVTQSQRKYLT